MEKIWLKRYPEGMPETIDPEHYHSLLDLFEKSFADYSDLPAFTNMGKVLTYSELDSATKRVASYIQNDSWSEKGRQSSGYDAESTANACDNFRCSSCRLCGG